jgi:hypothetical protein
MFTDNSLLFNSYTTPVAITVTGDSAVIDLTGAGVGNAPAMTNGVGNSIGFDVGAGDGAALPSVTVIVGTTFVGTGNTTMSVTLKAAPQVSATNYAQGTYTTLSITDSIPVANLVAGAVINIPIPPINLTELEALPRYYKLSYTVTNGPMTAGAVSAGIVLNQPNIGRYGNEGQQYPNNFTALPI